MVAMAIQNRVSIRESVERKSWTSEDWTWIGAFLAQVVGTRLWQHPALCLGPAVGMTLVVGCLAAWSLSSEARQSPPRTRAASERRQPSGFRAFAATLYQPRLVAKRPFGWRQRFWPRIRFNGKVLRNLYIDFLLAPFVCYCSQRKMMEPFTSWRFSWRRLQRPVESCMSITAFSVSENKFVEETDLPISFFVRGYPKSLLGYSGH